MFLQTAMLNVPFRASDEKLLKWWDSSANQMTSILSMYALCAAAILFLVPLNHVVYRLREREEGATPWANFSHGCGVAFAAVCVVDAGMRGAVGRMVRIDTEPLPDVDTLRFATGLGHAVFGVGGMLLAGATILGISIAALRTHALPKWFGVLGLAMVVGIAVAEAIVFGMLAIPAILIWTLALAFVLWRSPMSPSTVR